MEIVGYLGPNMTGNAYVMSLQVNGGVYDINDIRALEPDPLIDLNDNFESFDIPVGLQVRVCQHGGFGGACTVLTGEVPALGVRATDNPPPATYNFTNQISSLVISAVP